VERWREANFSLQDCFHGGDHVFVHAGLKNEALYADVLQFVGRISSESQTDFLVRTRAAERI
jgi:hypothetical protein